MDLFDIHRRDILNFDSYMDLKNPGFGGNDSLKYARDAEGKEIPKNNSENKLKGYRNVVERSPMFKHQHYNSTYKAMTNDLVYKQAGKEPIKYADPYLTGVATVEVGEYETSESVLPNFDNFINEKKEVPFGTGRITGEVKGTIDLNDNVMSQLSREKKILDKLKKKEKDVLTEGKCISNFNEFNVSENWFEEEYDVLDADTETAPVETEEEVETTTPKRRTGNPTRPTTPKRRTWSPTRPPKRKVDPNPKNKLEAAVQDLSDYLSISAEEAARILGIAMINSLEKEEDQGKSGEIDIEEIHLNAGPSCDTEEIALGIGPSSCSGN